MTTSNVWKEFRPKWPAGFWDDWMRETEQRKARSCIRPEISRTGMTMQGKKGASKGLFFNTHLKKIQLNTNAVNFTQMDLSYLLKDKYDTNFVEKVENLPKLTLEGIIRKTLETRDAEESYAVSYQSAQDFIKIADKLQIMKDFKAGVPRTAYKGIVTCYISKMRIYIVPDKFTWHGYKPHWED
ncbi:hypothetical protein L596_015122 [Steinernema carpocapsae]|uniref:Alpha-1,3-mannosyl-glycoprotein 2-beta-N-acetylglucosaminyltransferase n=1 Tax=Steinernema carpocapsae TaxID=34508 RepID=A0A4U5NFB4_STECR|nr:hypothetical protein L596_015122 [Steinernema carpocapsae]